MDWSSKNIIAISLENAVYTWNAKTNEAIKLAEYPANQLVSSVSWNPRGILLATGDELGEIQIFDTEKSKILRQFTNHAHRVGTISWNNFNVFASGSRDSKICISDLRCQKGKITEFIGHKQEVCGTKWSIDESYLASGGNDNKVYIWSLKMQNEISKFSEHVSFALISTPRGSLAMDDGGCGREN